MKRDTRTSRSARRPSRLKKPPGILPAAANFSTKSTVSGKKSMPGRGFECTAVTSTDGAAVAHQRRAGRLLGELAGFDGHGASPDFEGNAGGLEPIGHGNASPPAAGTRR